MVSKIRYRWLIASLLCVTIISFNFFNYNYIFINEKPQKTPIREGESYKEASEITNKSKFSVSKIEAVEIAEWRLRKSIQENDIVFKSFEQSTLGDPILVRTLEEEPSYWRVPVIFKDRIIGNIDIDRNKSIPRYGNFGCGKPDNLSACPSVITIIAPEEAVELAKNITARYPDANVSAPIFVHGDEKSHVAWMLKVEKGGKIISRVLLQEILLQEIMSMREGKEK